MYLKERNILIVDDDIEIIDIVKTTLHKENFINIFTANSCESAYEILYEKDIHFLILDIMLPDGSGYDILKLVRKDKKMPCLFLSAFSDMDSKYRGFMVGADDYLTKPFMAKELIFRTLAILNRSYPDYSKKIILEGVSLDFEKAIVYKSEDEIMLTAKEYRILELLYENKNKIVSLDTILNRVWGENSFGYTNTLMAHIRKIREKIEDNPSCPKNLVTVKGLGYKLVVDDER